MNILKQYIHSAPVQKFMNNSVLMNWSNLNKSMLVLFLGGIDHILWIIWYVWCVYSPSIHHWFNLEYFNFHIMRMSLCCIVSFLMILPCHFLRHNLLAQRFLPYISIIFFSLSFIYGGYSIGIMSPATIAGYISLVTVGLVLFERKIIYIIFIPITIYLLLAIVLSMMGQMKYAPIFSEDFNDLILYKNSFWVYTQMYFYIPIFFAALVLFEVLLSQWRNREKQINEISQIDPLTGIYNRRKIGSHLSDIQQHQQSYALVLLDLDHFKMINDTYGHDVGDQVLKRIAKILSSNLRGEDVVGRFGGEEFILILKNKNIGQAIEIAERCRIEIEKEAIFINKSTKIHVSASFGVALSNLSLNKEAVIRHADQALYQAKDCGRNQVKLYSGLASSK